MPKHIAIVEDEDTIRANYSEALADQGYRISGFATKDAAMHAFSSTLPDLVVIDINLGQEPEGGFDLCRHLRARAPELPIIFLTARNQELDIVSGFRLGADDYLTKDVSIAQLMVRVTALFRRIDALKNSTRQAERIQAGPLQLDLEKIRASWRENPIDLTVTEFWILHALASRPGHVKSRQQLMAAANTVLDDNTITSHVKRIRRKIGMIDTDFDAIQTVYGMGYRWIS